MCIVYCNVWNIQSNTDHNLISKDYGVASVPTKITFIDPLYLVNGHSRAQCGPFGPTQESTVRVCWIAQPLDYFARHRIAPLINPFGYILIDCVVRYFLLRLAVLETRLCAADECARAPLNPLVSIIQIDRVCDGFVTNVITSSKQPLT